MNDFVSKPIELENLYTTLIKSLSKDNKKQQDKKTDTELEYRATDTVEHNHAPEAIPDMEIIDALAAIMGLELDVGLAAVKGNLQMYVRLLRKFVASNKDNINSLNELLDKKLTEDARRLVHSVKGSAGTLGLIDLRGISSELEQAIKNGLSKDKVEAIMNQFEAELKTIVTEVENLP